MQAFKIMDIETRPHFSLPGAGCMLHKPGTRHSGGSSWELPLPSCKVVPDLLPLPMFMLLPRGRGEHRRHLVVLGSYIMNQWEKERDTGHHGRILKKITQDFLTKALKLPLFRIPIQTAESILSSCSFLFPWKLPTNIVGKGFSSSGEIYFYLFLALTTAFCT